MERPSLLFLKRQRPVYFSSSCLRITDFQLTSHLVHVRWLTVAL